LDVGDNMSLDSTLNYDITGPGGGGSAPSSKEDSFMSEPLGGKVSPSDSPAKNTSSPKLSKPESSDVVKSVFYDPQNASPGTLDTTLNDVLEISFNE
jgi:hypothetical protein